MFKLYVNASIHVALAISALMQITLLKLGKEGDNSFFIFIFLSSVIAYNFVKYLKMLSLDYRKSTKLMKNIQVLTTICGVLLLWFTFQMSLRVLLCMFPFVVITILYRIPVFSTLDNLRDIARLKIIIIGVVWVGVTVLVPMVYAGRELDFDMVIESVQRFLFVLVLMLPFEIRDLKYDAIKLETVPQIMGIVKTKILGSVLLLLFVLCTVMKDEIGISEGLETVLIAVICLLFLWNTKKEQSLYYCSFWVESIPIIWLGIVLLLEYVYV